MRDYIRQAAWLAGVCVLAPLMTMMLIGCGRSDGLVEVSGTVTLDGKPLPEAIVQFTAASNDAGYSRPATGRTDSGGHYQLEYSTGRTGTRPGAYKVSISTFWPSTLTNEEKLVPGSPEKIPDVYSSKSTLTTEVKPDGSEVNFELKSDAGPIVQPDAPRKTGSTPPVRVPSRPVISHS